MLMINQILTLGSRGIATKEWQEILRKLGHSNVISDGVFGAYTDAATRAAQKSKSLKVDGVVGDKTWGAFKRESSVIPTANPWDRYDWTPLHNWETGGKLYYEKFISGITWPGGQSGPTGGIGIDYGYLSNSEFDQYIAKHFSAANAVRLKSTVGKNKGVSGKAVANSLGDIKMPWNSAIQAFNEWTLPKFWRMTVAIYPELAGLCAPAVVALVGLVYNRGNRISGSSRVEMARIAPLVAQKDYQGIARQIRSMKRIWVGKKLDGLLLRREAEAKMVESCK